MGHSRLARIGTATACTEDHRPLRAPRLPTTVAGLLRSGQRNVPRQTHTARDRRGPVMARALPTRRNDATPRRLSAKRCAGSDAMTPPLSPCTGDSGERRVFRVELTTSGDNFVEYSHKVWSELEMQRAQSAG